MVTYDLVLLQGPSEAQGPSAREPNALAPQTTGTTQTSLPFSEQEPILAAQAARQSVRNIPFTGL